MIELRKFVKMAQPVDWTRATLRASAVPSQALCPPAPLLAVLRPCPLPPPSLHMPRLSTPAIVLVGVVAFLLYRPDLGTSPHMGVLLNGEAKWDVVLLLPRPFLPTARSACLPTCRGPIQPLDQHNLTASYAVSSIFFSVVSNSTPLRFHLAISFRLCSWIAVGPKVSTAKPAHSSRSWTTA